MAGLTQLTAGMTGLQFRNALNYNFAIPPKVYNVVDYGAVHDGVTDDTVAIQTAINACDAGGGGIVFFPNGVYIISGALQNDVGTDAIDYNSQLYIPASKISDKRSGIILLGESYNWFGAWTASIAENGVILKSTIAGSGVFPSVICSIGKLNPYSYNNYVDAQIENIKILVAPFEGTTGASMCGVNFLHADHGKLFNVSVSLNIADIRNSIVPVSHVFGIGLGIINNTFPLANNISANGFYYGIVIGESVSVGLLNVSCCHIGLMQLTNNVLSNINYLAIGSCAYTIASQQESFYGNAAGRGTLKINNAYIEKGYEGDGRTPAWCEDVDTILDADQRLFGCMDYQLSNVDGVGEYIAKSNGGLNFLVRNIYKGSGYHWTTATRPVLTATTYGTVGYNTTTNKLEVFNGSTWVDLH